MKSFITLTMLFLLVSFTFFSGCDSASDSVAIPTSTPELVSPINGDTVSMLPTFGWKNTGNRIEISRQPGFTNIIHSASVSGQNYTLSTALPYPNEWYYWHIGNEVGQNIIWSDTWKFYAR